MLIGHFFCCDNEPSTRSFPNILRTLAWHIARNDTKFTSKIGPLCNFPEDVQTMSIQSLWDKLFIDYLKSGTTDGPAVGPQSIFYLVIDGLDEAYNTEIDESLEILGEMDPIVRRSHRLQILLDGQNRS